MNHVLSVANREQCRANLPEDNYADSTPDTVLPIPRHESWTHTTPDPPIERHLDGNLQRITCDGVDKKVRRLIEIISEESGIDQSQLSDETSFVTVGIDSLLSLILTNRLKEELELDIGPRSSIFDRFSTVGELKNELVRSKGSDQAKDFCTSRPTDKRTPANAHCIPSSGTTTHHNGDQSTPTCAHIAKLSLQEAPRSTTKSDPAADPARPSTSLILQRSAHPCPCTLFLFPDGSGSPHSYVHIPRVHPELSIIGLICPYRHDPAAMLTRSFSGIMESYVSELRRVCPHGPYSLGGWSSGGVLAFEAARRLIAAGEKVRHLLLIDSPAPTHGLQKLPNRFYKHAGAAGLFGQIGAATATAASGDDGDGGDGDDGPRIDDAPPEWLIPHFKATIELLRGYRPEPLPMLQGDGGTDVEVQMWPKTSICWAGKRVFDGVRFPEMPGPGGADGSDDDDADED